MLFTPKKYGRDWTVFLAIGFYAAAMGLGVSAIFSVLMADNLSEKIFGFLVFLLGSIVFRALGKDQWNRASEMSADDGREP